MKKVLVVAAAATFAVAGLSACATTESEPTTPSESSSMVGGDPGTWTPVELGTFNSDTVVPVVVGQFARVDIPGVAALATSDAAVVTVSAPSTGQVGGVSAVAPGVAEVIAVDADGVPVASWSVMVMSNA